MEDSTGITIEFLRARLLAERSVSKSARQRANELTKRVAELEEQLKIVSMQRKKAEKATADVLAILEDNDISDMSDAYDSSSDQETQCESKVGNIPIKVNENYASLRVRRNGSEDSGSDHDSSSVSGRSLSWKGRKNAQNSPEKNKDSFMKRRGSSTSCDSSSPKHRQGKSCRQIRRRDSRQVAEYHKADRIKIDLKENETSVSPEMFPSTEDDPSLRGGCEILSEKDLHYSPHLSCLENKRSVTSDDLNIQGQGANNDMESALEHQAQLIGRYEGMERAQREWEEKFREKNSGTPDPYDPGSHSDVTDEKDEIKTHLQQPACTIAFQRTEVEYASISKHSVETQSRNFLHPSQDGKSLKNNKFPGNSSSESVFPDAAFPIPKGKKQPHENLKSNNEMNLSINSDNISLRVEDSGSQKFQNELYAALVPQKASSGFDGVLEALQKARVSLQQKMTELPLVEPGSAGKAIEPFVSIKEAVDKVNIPVGCAGLFRVPDFSVDTTTTNFFNSGSRLNLAGNYPDTSFKLTSGNQLLTNQYFGTQTSSNYQLLGPQISNPYVGTQPSSTDYLGPQVTSPYGGTQPSSTDYLGPQVTSPDARSGFSSSTSSYPSSPYDTDAQRFQPSENMSRSSTNRLDRYSNSSLQPPPSQYPSIHAYPDLISPPPVKHGFSTFRPSVRVPPTPTTDHFSFNNNQFSTNMYR